MGNDSPFVIELGCPGPVLCFLGFLGLCPPCIRVTACIAGRDRIGQPFVQKLLPVFGNDLADTDGLIEIAAGFLPPVHLIQRNGFFIQGYCRIRLELQGLVKKRQRFGILLLLPGGLGQIVIDGAVVRCHAAGFLKPALGIFIILLGQVNLAQVEISLHPVWPHGDRSEIGFHRLVVGLGPVGHLAGPKIIPLRRRRIRFQVPGFQIGIESLQPLFFLFLNMPRSPPVIRRLGRCAVHEAGPDLGCFLFHLQRLIGRGQLSCYFCRGGVGKGHFVPVNRSGHILFFLFCIALNRGKVTNSRCISDRQLFSLSERCRGGEKHQNRIVGSAGHSPLPDVFGLRHLSPQAAQLTPMQGAVRVLASGVVQGLLHRHQRRGGRTGRAGRVIGQQGVRRPLPGDIPAEQVHLGPGLNGRSQQHQNQQEAEGRQAVKQAGV